ncbi:hypothetical protein CIHG_04266 [Coccidioides immitis H538.4]|uniref:Uncharacterized protein n=2 Tax=Coccidioides immitis TaxID=5501 RepID=A0A0J8RNS6_COCIT|nr:hypothetical protein CIRG_09195 [Coccidioides immitis RMSCC 2394]KMU86477.1 hypothetical protein CIHG_04266 [Coccidioides immitis H538.4]
MGLTITLRAQDVFILCIALMGKQAFRTTNEAWEEIAILGQISKERNEQRFGLDGSRRPDGQKSLHDELTGVTQTNGARSWQEIVGKVRDAVAAGRDRSRAG